MGSGQDAEITCWSIRFSKDWNQVRSNSPTGWTYYGVSSGMLVVIYHA